MEVVSIQTGKVVGYDSASHSGLDIKQIIFTNLHLLGFDSTAMEIKYKIPFNKEMFNLPNKAGAEAVLYFLFNTLNPTLCRQEFRDCWPVIDKKSESTFRKVCCIWLQNIQKDEADSRLPRINASLFLSPGGPKDSFMLGFPTMTSQNKELGEVMETTCTCAAIRHRKHFFETLAKTVTVKSQWQSYSDEVAKNIRILSKEVKDLDRSKREQLLQASVNETAIGSLSSGGKQFQDVKSVSHSAKRMQKVQLVRGMWKNLETYIDRSQEEREIVSSIVDRTLQKFVIDAATVNISIPHLMLRECEQEIKRRNIDNIYDGGKLNLLSVLQLWNLALKMYIHRLNDKGLRDLSEEACDLKSQVHSHQAYLANTAALREKITKDIPQRKRNIEYLRSNFSYNEVNLQQSGPGMIAPSPPATFETSRGQHTGATPTSPILQKTPDYAKTPEIALDIVEQISQTSRKNKVAPYHASTFGIADPQNLNRNNSSSSRIPQPCQVRAQDKTKGGQTSMTIQDAKSNVRHRVVQHVNQQTTSTLSSLKTTTSSTKKNSETSRQHASSNLKNVKRLHIDSVSLPEDCNNSATETPQQRAHEILAERIVWSVMHEEKKPDETPRSKGSKSQLLQTALFPSKNVISPPSSPGLPVTSNGHSQRTGTDKISEHSSLTLHELEHLTAASRDLWKTSVKGKSLSSDVNENMVFDKAKSQVHQDQLKGAEGASHVQFCAVASLGSAVDSPRTQADNQQLCFEEEDASLANPVAAFGDDAFISHDLIRHSPAAAHIQHMWKEAISSCTENQDLSPAGKPGLSTNDNSHTDNLSQSQTLHGNVIWPKRAFTKGEVSKSNVKDLRDDNSKKPRDLTTETTDKNSPVAVNRNLLFMDSDEERQQEPIDAERSAVEREECMSALYCDDDIGRVDHTNDAMVVAALGLDSDFDEFFKTVTPLKRTAVGSDPTKESQPLISFTPENSVLSATVSPKDTSKDMPNKVNLDDLKLKHVVDSDQQSHSDLISVHNLTGTVKTIYSTGGYSTSEPKTNDDDDDLITSEVSLLNESFIPLHAGLFVRGRTSGDGTPRKEPASIHRNHLDDDDVAAKLLQLRKITAEVFKMDRSLAVAEHPETKVLTKPVSPSTPLCTDTGQKDSGEFNTVGILDEDETVLLPASPL